MHVCRPMKREFLLAMLIGMTLAGCKKTGPPPVETPVAAPSPQAASPVTRVDGTVTTPSVVSRAEALSAIERDMLSPNPEVYLKTLTDLLNGWAMSKNSVPTNVEDFVKVKMISRLPTPPPGKRLAIDRKAIKVVLVDQ